MISTLRPTNSVRPGRLAGGARPVRGRRAQVRLAAAATANRDLVWSLVEQARKETLPWVSDLLDPLMRRGIDGSAATAASSLPPPVHPRELADADSRFVEVDGVAVHYKEAPGASPSAPTVMLIHGFNGSTFSWRNTLEEVAAATGCRAVTYDRPPFGLTQRPLEWGRPGQALQYNPYELAGSVTLLEGLLARLGIDQVVVVGHSAGALVAVELQRRRPALVAALALVAPAVPTTPENSFQRRATLGQQLRFALTRAMLQSDDAGLRYVRRQLLRRRDEVAAGNLGFTPRPPVTSSASSSEGDGGGGPSAPSSSGIADDVIDGYLKPLRALDWDRGALLNLRAFSIPHAFDYASISVPVLVVQGRHDGGLARNAEALVELLRRRPGETATEFASLDCGHVPMDELPDVFNAELVGFVRRAVADGSNSGPPLAAASVAAH